MFFLNLRSVCTLELQVKSDRQLKVTLDCAALMGSLQRIKNFDVNFRPVKRAVTRVNRPGLAEFIERVFKSFFSLIPHFIGPETKFRTGRQLKIEGEPKDSINVLEEVQRVHDFISNLLRSAENMCVVLAESTHASEIRECA